jgi:hypothetical protein
LKADPAVPLRKSAFAREWQRGFDRFRCMGLARLMQDMARALRLHFGAARPRRMTPRSERIVVSLTTIPQRTARLLPTLRSLCDQTVPPDRIVLAWPSVSRRTGVPYPPPPKLPSGVDILTCDDAGPATKLLPMLALEPRALIIAVDDDVVYPVDFVETLVGAHRRDRNAAWGYRGWRHEVNVHPGDLRHIFATGIDAPVDVDVLLGTWGYLIPPGAFDERVHDLDSSRPELRWVDDVWFSGHLARRGVSRRVMPAKGLPIETISSFVAALTDGPNRSGHNDRSAIEAFVQWW